MPKVPEGREVCRQGGHVWRVERLARPRLALYPVQTLFRVVRTKY